MSYSSKNAMSPFTIILFEKYNASFHDHIVPEAQPRRGAGDTCPCQCTSIPLSLQSPSLPLVHCVFSFCLPCRSLPSHCLNSLFLIFVYPAFLLVSQLSHSFSCPLNSPCLSCPSAFEVCLFLVCLDCLPRRHRL